MAESCSEDYKAKFMSVFSELVQELTEGRLLDCPMIDAIQHLKEVMDYELSKGECIRGLMVIESLCYLVKEVTPDLEKKALILGWCVEWLQSFFLVTNDIMNQSNKAGKYYWYKKEAIGLIFTVIKGAIYLILKKYFKTESYYVQLLELFHEITYFTEVGQCLDMKTSDTTDDLLDTFTIDRYMAIVKYKTASYSFYLPVAVVMYMVGIDNDSTHSAAKGVLLSIGEFSQIQDDYIDCYGDTAAVAGKTGTNIEKCKCDWLIVQALKRATPEQKEKLKANYGKDDAECVKKVKELYNQIHIQDVYTQYEDESYSSLMVSLDKELVGTGLPRELFVEFADRIYKRKK